MQRRISLHSTEPNFYYKVVGNVEVTTEAPTLFDDTPSIGDVNQLMGQQALAMGADAIINVEYERGFSWTSWRVLTGRGIAVIKVPVLIPENCKAVQ